MKKLLLALTFVFTLSIASISMAATPAETDSAVLARDQVVAELVVNNIDKANGYKAIESKILPDAKKALTAAKFTEVSKTLQKDFGAIQQYVFVGFERAPQYDSVAYIVVFQKAAAVVNVSFTKEGQIVGMIISPIQPAAPAQAKK